MEESGNKGSPQTAHVCNPEDNMALIMRSAGVHTYLAHTGHSVSEVMVVRVVFRSDSVELNQQLVVVIDSLDLGREWRVYLISIAFYFIVCINSVSLKVGHYPRSTHTWSSSLLPSTHSTHTTAQLQRQHKLDIQYTGGGPSGTKEAHHLVQRRCTTWSQRNCTPGAKEVHHLVTKELYTWCKGD